jgi:crossover junction endonuclease MUS81
LTVSQNQSLYIIPDDRIHRPTYSELQRQLRLQHPTKPHLTSVQAFKRLNSKNASMTHRDVWCKMLLTIAGLSPEKVAAIVEVYPTPLSLSRAFKEAEHVERAAKESAIGLTGKAPKIPLAENLLANDNPGSNRQKIGPALSRKIYELIRAKKYPSIAEAD